MKDNHTIAQHNTKNETTYDHNGQVNTAVV